ncbi:TolC family protein [Pseudomonas sp. OV226]|uniref:TolC family protein n=1 Tax=Pseudomonas sp. OV226 TaxID=2135588 RepID=UPI000D6C12D7|nr:TolC family protein [Pseudomonas sp. OV226]PWK29714.1 adhesin transport system outer membrane protein [Pseudomonas sp. OV226]
MRFRFFGVQKRWRRFSKPPTLYIGMASIALCLSSPRAYCEELPDLLRMTGEHPSVAAARSEANASESDITVAKAEGKVHVNAGIDSRSYTDQPGYHDELFSPFVSANKLLYDHGRLDATVNERSAAYQASLASVKWQREIINKQLTTLYTTALSQHVTGNILQEQVNTLQALRDKVSAIARIDPGRASEVHQVDSRLASAMANREGRAIGEHEAWKQITNLLHQPVTLTHDLPDLSRMMLLPQSEEQAEQLLLNHPELLAARAHQDESLAALDAASKWNRPRWTIDVRAQSQRDRQNGGMEFGSVVVQLSSNLSLLDGGGGAANTHSQAQHAAAAESAVENASRELQQEFQRLWVALPIRKQQLTELEAAVDAADRMRATGEEQFFAGRRPLTDLMGFDSEYYNARISYEEQRIQYLSSQWLIMSALGQLSDLADVSRPWQTPRLADIANATGKHRPAGNTSAAQNPRNAQALRASLNSTLSATPAAGLPNLK